MVCNVGVLLNGDITTYFKIADVPTSLVKCKEYSIAISQCYGGVFWNLYKEEMEDEIARHNTKVSP